MTTPPNQTLERMPGSERTSPLQSGVVGALPGIAQLGRSTGGTRPVLGGAQVRPVRDQQESPVRAGLGTRA